MGGEKKDDEGGGNEKKRKIQPKWTQMDTERLCELVHELGRDGILNKATNAATNEIRKQEWEKIAARYNSSPNVIIYFVFALLLIVISVLPLLSSL